MEVDEISCQQNIYNNIRYCFSCFSQAGKEAGERARGRSEKSPLVMSSSLPPTQSEEKVEEGGDWRSQQEDQGPHEGGAPGRSLVGCT